MGKIRSLTAALTTAAVALSLTACTDQGPTAQEAATGLAGALSSLDISDVPFAEGAPARPQETLEAIVGALKPLKPTVKVDSVEETEDDTATANLSVIWDIDETDQDWTYTTTANLTRGEEEWQVGWEPGLIVEGLAEGEVLIRKNTPADRADIFGAGGAVLVTDRPVVHVGIDKTRVEDSEAKGSATVLAKLLDMDSATYSDRVAAAGPDAFVEAIVLREDNREITDEQIAAIAGARAIEDTMELAPTREFARATLGSVGQATAEMIEESDGELQAGDVTGLSGLQSQYDEQLRGTPGISITALPATPEQDGSANDEATAEEQEPTSAEPRELFTKTPISGKPLKTTLDAKLQSLAEGILEQEPSATSIVTIRPSTGDILTVANGPGSKGYNTALLGQYPPGSTFKMATTLALLRHGFTPDSPTQCTESVTVDGATFKNAPTYPENAVGTVPLRSTFAHSCNTGFIAEHDTVSQQDLSQAAAAMGIGVETPGVGLPVFFGAVPAEATGTAHAASMIGQGQVLVSPFALARAAASIGAGERISPTLLAAEDKATESAAPSSSATPSLAPTATATPSSEAAPSITAEESRTLRSLMRSVVTDGGAALLAEVPGEPVLAKTGTAEFGSEDPPRTHAWIVALHGDLAVAVFVEEGEYGSTSGGPLLKEFLTNAR
ncbi:penicillin-binding transpeptidase domain-containing protein [Arthrobacter roseus]|uniref:penicillin-binding transpeptidase domain-containing protein n=1 Tax=Arthrobacter roseus TaxID=136274 RepID=UPI001964E337|nr:penicillin-binding transpeptidase domain-containing protein [Arthrobacter roseus]MBM7849685.1 cell division protein FtsI/penicillin-binding protein 2 [Arthrobacter roseus]